jgi:coniferyl-aldehyde dehydrogenase
MSVATVHPDPSVALEAALDTHRAAFRADPFPPLSVRRKRVRALIDGLNARRDAFAEAIASDFGHRSRHETLMADISVSVLGLKHTLKHLKKWMRPEKRPVPLHFLPASARVVPQPLGVVGVISPWNYPVQLAVVPVGQALAAGNRVMLKPSELTPATSRLLGEMLGELFPADLVSVHEGGPDVGEAFSRLRVDHLFYTGSTHVGRLVMKAAADNLVPVTLELGGKSPALVAPDADLDRAADRIANGKLFNAGQTCVAPDYVLVPRDQLQPLVDKMKERVAAKFPTLADNDDYTAVVNDRHRQRLSTLRDEAVAAGARAVSLAPEGDRFAEGDKLAPTVLLDVPDDARVMHDEIFGPLLPVVPYDHYDQALAYITERPRPLALYIFSTSRDRIERTLQTTHAGGVTVNDCMLHVAQDTLPFGGVGPSGMGAYHGKEGFDTFSHRKAVFEQPRINAGFLLDPPYGKAVERLIDLLTR